MTWLLFILGMLGIAVAGVSFLDLTISHTVLVRDNVQVFMVLLLSFWSMAWASDTCSRRKREDKLLARRRKDR